MGTVFLPEWKHSVREARRVLFLRACLLDHGPPTFSKVQGASRPSSSVRSPSFSRPGVQQRERVGKVYSIDVPDHVGGEPSIVAWKNRIGRGGGRFHTWPVSASRRAAILRSPSLPAWLRQNQIVVAPGGGGANRQFGPELAPPPDGSAPAAPVLLQTEIDPATTAACAARWTAAGARVIWNLAPAPEVPPSAEVLAAVEFLLVNEVELAALTGTEAPATATDAGTAPAGTAAIAGPAAVAEQARALVADGRAAPVRNLIVTLGADGCLWVRRGGSEQVELQHQPALPATAVDTVGAAAYTRR